MIQAQPNGIYTADALARLAWVEHGFGTRAQGGWPEAARLATLRQIHSADVLEADRPGLTGEADGLITNEPGLLVGVKTADCVPILLADDRHRSVAAIHAGWRGTAQAIVLRVIERMSVRYGTHPADVYAAIGPCIHVCCYEVGPEVARQFRKWMPELQPGDKQKLDLVEVNRRQLTFAGVTEWHIAQGAPCTFCRPLELHSFRRDGVKAGRMISAIGVRGEA